MPRRKGHGVSPAKRSQANKDDQQAKKKAAEISAVAEAPNGSHEAVSRAESPQPAEVRYLHKKFKKLAAGVDAGAAADGDGEGEEEAGRYACPYCRLACAKPSVLQKHVRAHTGERPYPCRPCGFAFKTRSNLYKHCRSRAHSLRVEEGAGPQSPPASPADSGDDADGPPDTEPEPQAEGGDTEPSASSSPSLSLSSVGSGSCSSTPTPTVPAPQPPSRPIYKPKFHKAVLYCQQQDEAPSSVSGSDTASPPLHVRPVHQQKQCQEQDAEQQQLQSQSERGAQDVQNPPTMPQLVYHSTSNSPSPEVITRHITNIITHNQHVVSCSWPKKMHLHRQQLQQQPDHSSRLAAALLRPNRGEATPSPRQSEGSSTCSTPEPMGASMAQQPLNLSSRPALVSAPEPAPGLEAPHRIKLSGHIAVTVPQQIVGHLMRDHNLGCGSPSAASADSSAALALLDDLASATSKEHTAENSIIKRLLLKRRAAEAAAAAAAAAESGSGPLDTTSQSSDDSSAGHAPTSFQFVCSVCKIPFRSAENLETHQLYYCTRRARIANTSGGSYSSNEDGMHHRTSLKVDIRAAVSSGERVAPPFPSPGPLLGSTPLIDSYRPEDKRRRLDSERSSSASSSCCTSPLPSLRSIEELAKGPPPAPPRPNSLQMFGGEVQILDAAGEMKTLRIEPSTRGNGQSPGRNVSHMGGGLVVGPASTAANVVETGQPQSPHIVVTIARSGLHSGGTVVQLPTTTTNSGVTSATTGTIPPSPSGSSSSGSSRTPRTSGGGVVSPKPTLSNPPPMPASAAPALFPAARLVTPNITTPDLAVPGIPPPGRSLPFPVAFPAFINPLTHITAYNPLTLPPPAASGTTGTAGVVTIQYGGKVIPHVPGIPGPQTLLLRHAAPLDLAVTAGSMPASPPTRADSPQISKTPVKSVATSLTSSPASSRRESRDESVRLPSLISTSPTRKLPKFPSPLPSIKVDCAPAAGDIATERLSSEDPVKRLSPSKILPPRKFSRGTDSVISVGKNESTPLTVATEGYGKADDMDGEKIMDSEDGNTKNGSKDNSARPRFLRPTSLPLKPGTFTPKKVHGAGLTPVLPLVSPETPRPKKSYGQLYLNGHAYTYLGLKCSARSYYCTLNRLQPIYVLLSQNHAKLSMYSKWQVYSEAAPNPLGLEARKAMALYDSRHRPAVYTVAKSSEKHSMVMTHSSYWLNRSLNHEKNKNEEENKKAISEEKGNSDGENDTENKRNGQEALQNGEQLPKRVKIFDGGFESNEEYTYVRGRGRGRYVCEECGIRCKKPSMLKKHIRTHTDVRPFTCKHCNFRFKTKGNLTKHMKSKAHYKKCVELGIVPVPTVVDDSYIDEESLAKQQAMRASRMDDGETDSEDNDEEDEDEDGDGDGEDDDDDDEQMAGDEDCEDEMNKAAVEREAARSLLSLSRGDGPSSPGLASAGLIPVVPARPNTYPYLATTIVPTPHTPTLSTVSAQTEREKVSHNTGLALGLEGTAGGGLVVQTSTNRYYFPSSRTTTSTPQSTSAVSSPSTSEMTFVTVRDKESVPVDLSTRPQLPLLIQTQPTTPVSEILTPVSEPATLLASLCSSAERCPPPPVPPAPAPAEATMLQAYLTERALQDARVKRHQVLQPEPTTAISDVAGNPCTQTQTFTGSTVRSESGLSYEMTLASVAATTVVSSSTSISISITQSSDTQVESVIPSKSPVQTPPLISQHPLSPSTTQHSSAPETTASAPGGPRAEFMPPSSGPSPSYVSMTDDGRSMCSICNKIFSKPSQLRLHVNIHYFERPFRCESCAVSFRTKGHLQKHERSVSHQNKVSMNSTFGAPTTTNPRPFKCDDCKIAFRIHGHLAKHLRSKMHIMKLECVGKLPFGTYAEMEREGISLNEIDTTDCENSLESLQVLAQKLYEKDPSKLGQWDGERGLVFLPNSHNQLSGGETSSDEGEPLIGYQSPHYQESVPPIPTAANHDLVSVASSQLQCSKTDQTFIRPSRMNSHVTPSNNISLVTSFETKYDDLISNHFSKSNINKSGRERVVQLRPQISAHPTEIPNKEYFKLSDVCQNNLLQVSSSVQYTDRLSTEIQPKDSLRQVRNNCVQIQSFESRAEYSSEKSKGIGRLSSETVNKESSFADTRMKRDNEGNLMQMIFLCKICKKIFPNKSDLQVHNFISHEPNNSHTQRSSPHSVTLLTDSLPRTSPTCNQKTSNIPSSVPVDSNISERLGYIVPLGQRGNNCVGDAKEHNNPPVSEEGDSYQISHQLPSIHNTQDKYKKLCNARESESKNIVKNNSSLNDARTAESRTVLPASNVRCSPQRELSTDFYSEKTLRQGDNYVIKNLVPNYFGLDICTFNTNNGELGAGTGGQESNVIWKEVTTMNVQCGKNAQCKKNERPLDDGNMQNRVNDNAKSNPILIPKDKTEINHKHLKSDSAECNSVDKRLCCELCGKPHSSRESLQKHILSHTQIRPFVCEVCDAGFTSQHLLESHLQMHRDAIAHL